MIRALAVASTCVACTGSQSTLEPAGLAAERIARLFWGMTVGAVILWVAVVGLALYALLLARRPHTERRTRILVLGGGVFLPTLILAGLLTYGLSMLPSFLAPAPEGSLTIHVTGEQWWWRIRYLPPSGEPVVLANEIVLPVGEPVEFQLESFDVIHSFWIPALGGKVDMIPGRKTRLRLDPSRTGVFRGVCAEYCGSSHAYMNFQVVVLEREAFTEWLEAQRRPAQLTGEPLAARGRQSFHSNGCGACHTIRGTEAAGVVGPDLTHVGSRATLGAGMLGNDAAAFRTWLAKTQELKPSVHMPAFWMLPPDELDALAAFLEALQ